MEKQHFLTQAEWQVMELLWQQPHSLMDLVAKLSVTVGWSKSTVATMVRRMEAKQIITYDTENRAKIFRAVLGREDAALRETHSLLHRAYHGSIGMMVSALAQRDGLTKEDIEELYAILKEAEEKDA